MKAFHFSKKGVALLVAVLLLILPACAPVSSLPLTDSKLKVGIEGLTGSFNPFYSDRTENAFAMTQMFERIQRQGSENRLQNLCGCVTYEPLENGQVKYTVSLDANVRFSDGTYATADDVIFYYYFLSDAGYDGPLSDWLENDIVGLKEYYYDDKNYQSALDEIAKKAENYYSAETISEKNLITFLTETKLDGTFESRSTEEWGAYCAKKGFQEDFEKLGKNPTKEKLLALLATVEAQTHSGAYNPLEWWREKLTKAYIEKNYSDGIQVESISGISKVNDHCCTVLLNSVTSNTTALLNPLIIPKSVYGTGYVKGSADVVKQSVPIPVGSGAFAYEKYNEKTATLSLTANPYYHKGKPAFDKLILSDCTANNLDPVKSVKNGTVDICETSGTQAMVDGAEKEKLRYDVTDASRYQSVIFNCKTVSEAVRQSIIKVTSLSGEVQKTLGSCYTALYMPLSLRFGEYPAEITEPFYATDTAGAKALLTQKGYVLSKNEKGVMQAVDGKGKPLKLEAVCCGDENSLAYTVFQDCVNSMGALGIQAEIVPLSREEYEASLLAGNGDMWCGPVEEGLTADCYERFSSKGAQNYARISDNYLDALLKEIRATPDYPTRCALTSEMLQTVMNTAAEIPLYQQKNITIYNPSAVDTNSIGLDVDSQGCRYLLSDLEPA